jgi:hypothetical protein
MDGNSDEVGDAGSADDEGAMELTVDGEGVVVAAQAARRIVARRARL